MTASPSVSSAPTVIFNREDIERTLKRLAHEVLEANQGAGNLVIIGILTRGKFLAARLAQLIESLEGMPVAHGELDVTLYRDDTQKTFKSVLDSRIPDDLTGKTVILVDDVIFSGRSIRAALDALNDFGRPASVQLLVLLDRGHRELPIHPNFVGKNVPTAKAERVNVQLLETDDTEQVTLSKPAEAL